MARATTKTVPAVVPREEVLMRVAELKPNPRNPRIHSEMQIERLMASLRTDGQTKPVMARLENKMLIAGHGVTEAMRRLGFEMANVVLLDVPQDRADRIMLGDNRQSDISTTDKDLVHELLREINEADYLATGFSDEEAAKMLQPVEAGELKVVEIDVTDRQDQFWISVSGPLRDQALALNRIKTLMGEMPKVTVVLGTTDDLS